MSEIADNATVTVFVADYASFDGKLSAIGIGFDMTHLEPDTGNTAPQTVVARITVPPQHYHDEMAVAVGLYNDAGDLVMLPGPVGEAQGLRISQVLKFEVPNTGANNVPRGALPSSANIVLSFPTGLPLEAGRLYRWMVELDGDLRPERSAAFFVVSPPVGPVIG